MPEGRFREDLFYRINTVEIHVPSLSERADDIPMLAAYFLQKYASKYHKSHLRLLDDAVAWMQKHSWPGNIRELEHALERAVILSEGSTLGPDDFRSGQNASADFHIDDLNLQKLEAWAVRKALSKHGGNVSHAADELGISRGALYRRIEQYGI